MKKTIYLQSTTDDIAKYVVFSGDPGRVKKVIDLMDDVREVSINREFHTYTGTYKGVKITVTSTGIGGPSAAIALEEMYQCGMEVAVRLGTVMGLKDNLGKFVIPKGVMREEKTSHTYVPASFPAVADYDLVNCMNKACKENGGEFENSLMCSLDGYYCEMKELRLSKKMGLDVKGKINSFKKYNIAGLDMESGVVLTLTNLMDIKGCVVTLATVLENMIDYMEDEKRVKAEEQLSKIVLDGIVNYAKEVDCHE